MLTKEKILSNNSGIIEFRSYYGFKGHKRRVRPISNGSGWYKGVPYITEKIRSSGLPYVDPTNETSPLSNVVLEHGSKFDLSVETDRIILEWLLELTFAINLDSSQPAGATQTFFVYNKELDISTKRNRIEEKDDAILTLRKLSQDSLYNIARLMGYRLTNLEPEEVRMYLRDTFDDPKKGYENVTKFMKVVNDPDKDIKNFIFKAVDRAIITLTTKGEYKYQDNFIGYSFEAVVAWFRNKENLDLIMRIREEMGDNVIPQSVYRPEENIEQEANEDKDKEPSKRGRPKS
jgi:hypothetical protein